MSTAKSPKKPQDRKPKQGADETASTVVAVELDGYEIVADFAAYRNLRLMRRMKKGDISAVIDMVEDIFGDQTDAIEEHFDLTTDEDWSAFLVRIAEAANPNS